jgi:hypothetical protein
MVLTPQFLNLRRHKARKQEANVVVLNTAVSKPSYMQAKKQ